MPKAQNGMAAGPVGVMKALQCMRRASQVKLVSNVLLRGPMILGAHESTAGGLSTAFGRGAIDGCRAIQVFTKNGSQWREPELTDSAIATFREAREAAGHPAVLAHASYLINLGTDDAIILQKSIDALVAEVERSSALGIDYVVLYKTSIQASTSIDLYRCSAP